MKVKPKKKSREEIADPQTAIYHFKIYLLNISPMIYKRFKIKGDNHIAQLHHLIQIIMGWGKSASKSVWQNILIELISLIRYLKMIILKKKCNCRTLFDALLNSLGGTRHFPLLRGI